MTTKLTLTIEQSVAEKAKIFAKGHQKSLSKIVNNFLKEMVDSETDSVGKSKVETLGGSLPLPKDFDEKKALDEYYREKYGL
ncbi:hypothetical protein SAMN05443429_11046 [Cruoricaptor ignavus]|uniref:Uncharacterized protein n=1 Tax=Cruoricaptor ignavus TaxID=1118202 RepID=A0A1M6GVT5_9FLAO|nr:DUF6364 family protein [Cruoricaptor ignavus]QOR73828.1 hypothetical protein IMZ16_10060 [Cruoricaptor ignavus]SHJ14067.1 hypothetical protein SAMN05443429_11046 [Cruoricaptor ignavus]